MNMIPFLVFEVIIVGLFCVCLRHAILRKSHLLELILAIPYGIVLENAMVVFYGEYHYGPFLDMIYKAPLSIGLMWAVVIYAVMAFSDRIKMSNWLKPLLESLIAVGIDLVLDPLAIRLGYWSWNIPLNEQWFGAIWPNFIGWLTVVAVYSYWMRWGRKNFEKPEYGAIAGFILSMITLPFAIEVVRRSGMLMASILGLGSEIASLYVLLGMAGLFALILGVYAVRKFHMDGGPSGTRVVDFDLKYPARISLVEARFRAMNKRSLPGGKPTPSSWEKFVVRVAGRKQYAVDQWNFYKTTEKIYLSRCGQHKSYFVDYLHGYSDRLDCPKCARELYAKQAPPLALLAAGLSTHLWGDLSALLASPNALKYRSVKKKVTN